MTWSLLDQPYLEPLNQVEGYLVVVHFSCILISIKNISQMLVA